MSAAATATTTAATATAAAEAPPPAKGRKKLIILIAAAAFALATVGGGAVYLIKKKAAADAEANADGDTEELASESQAAPARAAKRDNKAAPVFVPLDPFTVNLADREAERYAQIGITLEIDEAQTGDRIKAYMPAIRNNILMTIADRTAGELLGREGKSQLAEKIRREISRVLGAEVDDEGSDAAAKAKPAKKKKKKGPAPPLPIRAVHFSNFIIQ